MLIWWWGGIYLSQTQTTMLTFFSSINRKFQFWSTSNFPNKKKGKKILQPLVSKQTKQKFEGFGVRFRGFE